MNDLLEGLKRKRRQLLFKGIFGLMVYVVAIVLTIKWYDWRLSLLIFLYQFQNNLSRKD